MAPRRIRYGNSDGAGSSPATMAGPLEGTAGHPSQTFAVSGKTQPAPTSSRVCIDYCRRDCSQHAKLSLGNFKSGTLNRELFGTLGLIPKLASTPLDVSCAHKGSRPGACSKSTLQVRLAQVIVAMFLLGGCVGIDPALVNRPKAVDTRDWDECQYEATKALAGRPVTYRGTFGGLEAGIEAYQIRQGIVGQCLQLKGYVRR
jgi:hypothetical protein